MYVVLYYLVSQILCHLLVLTADIRNSGSTPPSTDPFFIAVLYMSILSFSHCWLALFPFRRMWDASAVLGPKIASKNPACKEVDDEDDGIEEAATWCSAAGTKAEISIVGESARMAKRDNGEKYFIFCSFLYSIWNVLQLWYVFMVSYVQLLILHELLQVSSLNSFL